MKKRSLFLLVAAVVLAGCASKEQEQQIRLFWLQQYTNLMMKKIADAQQNLAKDPRMKEFAAALQKINAQPLPAAPQQPAPRAKPPQIMEVSMSEDLLPGKASEADRARMKRALEAVQLSNQATLSDIETTFGGDVKYKAFLITAKTERQLKNIAAQSTNFTAYFNEQQKLLKNQEAQINQLLLQNTGSIKKIRQ